jgi:hypothetical protein
VADNQAAKGGGASRDEAELPSSSRALAPYRQSQSYDRPLSRHRLQAGEQKARGLWGAASLLVALGALVSIPFALNESSFTAVLASAIAIGFAWLAAITLRLYVAERAAAVSVHDGYLRLVAGGQTEQIPWQSVRSVQIEYSPLKDGTLVPVAAISITRADGTQLLVPRAIEEPEALARALLEHTAQPLTEGARLALARGGAVSFGTAILATNKGISINGKTWAWQDQPFVRALGAYLHIGAARDPLPPSVVLVSDVQNLHVLSDLIDDPTVAQSVEDTSSFGHERVRVSTDEDSHPDGAQTRVQTEPTADEPQEHETSGPVVAANARNKLP